MKERTASEVPAKSSRRRYLKPIDSLGTSLRSPQISRVDHLLERLATQLQTRPIVEIAALIRNLTYGDMIDLAEGIGTRNRQDRPLRRKTCRTCYINGPRQAHRDVRPPFPTNGAILARASTRKRGNRARLNVDSLRRTIRDIGLGSPEDERLPDERRMSRLCLTYGLVCAATSGLQALRMSGLPGYRAGAALQA